ncbi:NB-ARC domain-containing protein [Planktothrix paucivesiculata]|uniref:WD-repeat protein n=1 Tax=Planktothrix paucivesiculata PCC 9631 TaxID=671071 RepID=A0A7Z9DZ82_9CYAN|nr:NB-ARC domain-containing protein [Planktothrix paucivesiculata]VXD20045.1 putative WD-repeat protein [Planktothrix paucivesiculata PCC 9631]
MNTEEALKLADELVFAHTGKHLEHLQKAVLEGTLQGHTYTKIAGETYSSEGYVRDIGSKLWKLLSEELGENLTKSNVRAKLDKLEFNNFTSATVQGNVTVNNLNFCPNQEQSHSSNNNQSNSTQPKKYYDLKEAPEISSFYNRTSELSILKQWILEENIRLITIYGLSEMGKSSLTVQLISQIKDQFDLIIWRSLSNTPKLLTLQTNIIESITQYQDISLPTLLDYFSSERCLLILDDVHCIFSYEKLAGQYQQYYDDYTAFFQKIATSCHNSCLILLSWEKPRDIATLEAKNSLLRTLQLKGLGEEGKKILKEKGLMDEENWSELIALYQGHPVWLKIIANTIKDLFNSSVTEFLACNILFLGDIEPLLQRHWQRLSKPEKQIVVRIAQATEPVEMRQLLSNFESSHEDILTVIQSLGRRGLVERVTENRRSLLILNPIFKLFVTIATD